VIETEEGQRLHEGMIKMLTGTDVIVARQLYGATFQFPPSFLIPFATNERPIVRGTNIAIWRRLRLIPFTVDIPEDLRDRQMPEKLRAEDCTISAQRASAAACAARSGLAKIDPNMRRR